MHARVLFAVVLGLSVLADWRTSQGGDHAVVAVVRLPRPFCSLQLDAPPLEVSFALASLPKGPTDGVRVALARFRHSGRRRADGLYCDPFRRRP
jgi:hypothetical protein